MWDLSHRVTEPFDEYSKFDMRYSVFEYRMLSNIEPFRTLGIFNRSIEPPPITNLFESFRYSIGRFIEYRISNPDRICRKLVYKSSRRGAKWARGNGQWAPAGRTVPNVTPLVGTWGMSLLSLKIGYSDVYSGIMYQYRQGPAIWIWAMWQINNGDFLCHILKQPDWGSILWHGDAIWPYIIRLHHTSKSFQR